MAIIDLSAQLNGTSGTTAEGRMSMSLSATLRGKASSMGPRPPTNEKNDKPKE